MDEEQIVRNEALKFYEMKIGGRPGATPIDRFQTLKHRLQDFYTQERKSIFLDEVEKLIRKSLKRHIDESHFGNPDAACYFEKDIATLLFYIKQEVETFPIIAHQRFKSEDHEKRSKVFISYSHIDKSFLAEVQRHFKPFLSKIDYWDDHQIEPGKKWKDEIRKAIDKTKVAILLVSTDFLGSEFIINNELPPLLKAAEEEGAVILIVILKPCLFEEINELNQFQTVNPPSKPLSKMDDNEKEDLLVNLVRQTKKILEPKEV